MPRVTRAARRSQETHAELNEATSTPLPLTPIKGRAPLGESAGNIGTPKTKKDKGINEAPCDIVVNEPKKGKKGNAAKKVPKKKSAKTKKEDVKVLEDNEESEGSSAADEAAANLSKDLSGMSPQQVSCLRSAELMENDRQ